MIGAIRHRGPDELGLYRDAHIGLAHARLAIVDVEAGQQPFASARGDLWTSYNGEIYNHVELRAELEASGFVFRTRCDTEVLLAAYEAWGAACVERFEGQFAFAIWDVTRRRLCLARDRFGVRPLYWTRTPRRLAFASEAKALLTLGDVPRAIAPRALDEVFTYWTPLAPRSIFEGIHALRPGHVALLELGGELRERAYFDPSFAKPSTPPPIEDSEAMLEHALVRATSLRLSRSDVPVGAYLSGGLDSSVIAALARRAHPGPLRTFSLRFTDEGFDEGPYQELMVRQLETTHDELVIDRDDVARAFEEVIYHVEQPILRTAAVPLFLLSKRVHDLGIKVVLTGEGADEVLGGYDLFREAKLRRFWARQPTSRLRPLLMARLYPWLARGPREAGEMAERFFRHDVATDDPLFSHLPRFRAAMSLKRLFSRELTDALHGSDALAELTGRLPPAFPRFSPLARAQYLEMRTLLSGYLLSAQGDRASMAHSVEGRYPFLDRDVVECASRMPDAHKLHVLDEKYVLKRLAAQLVPRAILERPKTPYRAPDALSFFGRASSVVDELLSEPQLREAGLFDPLGVSRLVAKCRRAALQRATLANADNMALVGVLSTQALWHELVKKPPRRARSSRVIDRSSSP